jgi:hypothetical protein
MTTTTTVTAQNDDGMNGYSNQAIDHEDVVTASAAGVTPTIVSSRTTTAIVAERAKSSLTFKEVVAPGLMVEVELRRILAGPVQSLYQKVEILDTYFGKV